LKWSLQQALPLKNSSWASGKPVETEKRLLISLMLTIGEWCMKLPMDMMLASHEKNHPSLFSSVFEVIKFIMIFIVFDFTYSRILTVF